MSGSLTGEHLRATYEAAMASLDDGQRWAMFLLLEATCSSSFQAPTVERRLDAAFAREAAAIRRTLAGEVAAEASNAD